jgi:uncharacterized membrane protein YhaH (DUF805 family)
MNSVFSWKWRLNRRDFFITCFKVIGLFLCFNIIPITYSIIPGLDNNDYKDKYRYYTDKIEEITWNDYYYYPIPINEEKKLEKYEWYDQYIETKEEFNFKENLGDIVIMFTLLTFKINIIFIILVFYLLNVALIKRMHDIWISWGYLFLFHFFNILLLVILPLVFINFCLFLCIIWMIEWDKKKNKYN